MLATETKALGAALLNGLGLFDAYAFLRRKRIGSQVAIVLYHRVCPRKDDWSLKSQMSLRTFESQIQYLRQNYLTLSLDELVRYLEQGKSLPKRAVVITFDDGYRDNYLHAFPILRKYRVPATFFLTTGHIGVEKPFWWDRVGYLVHHAMVRSLQLDELGTYSLRSAAHRRSATFAITDKLNGLPEEKKNDLIRKLPGVCRVDIPSDLGSQLVLSWDEVAEMSRDGAQFGAHSVTHPLLTSLSPEQAKWEICQSKEDIEKRLRKKVDFFSYPDGRFNSEIVEIVKQSGFVAAVATHPSLMTPQSDLYRLGRIGMTDDPNTSAALLSGFWGNVQGMFGGRQ